MNEVDLLSQCLPYYKNSVNVDCYRNYWYNWKRTQ